MGENTFVLTTADFKALPIGYLWGAALWTPFCAFDGLHNNPRHGTCVMGSIPVADLVSLGRFISCV